MKNLCCTLLSLSAISLSLLSACGSNNKQAVINLPTDGVATQYRGNWAAPAYGKVWKIDHDSILEFSYTSDFCMITNGKEDISTDDVRALFRLSADGNALEEYTLSSTSGFNQKLQHYQKEASLPLSCQTNLIATRGQDAYQPDAERDLKMFYQLYQEHYVDFALKGVDWQSLYASQASNIKASSGESGLFEAIANMLMPLSDPHNVVIFADGRNYNVYNKPVMFQKLTQEFARLNGLPVPLKAEHITSDIAAKINAYIEQQMSVHFSNINDYADDQSAIKTAANEQLLWFTRGELGYLRINNMAYFTKLSDSEVPNEVFDAWYAALNSALDRVIEDFASTQGVIIDVRTNTGGQETFALAIAGRFADQKRHAYSKQARLGDQKTPLNQVFVEPLGASQYNNKIVLLTSATTTSAAEYFAQTLSVMPHVTVVGEATQGAFSTTLDWALPVGFKLKLSNEYFYDSKGNWLESLGVPVDVEVPFSSQADRLNGKDSGIELAAALLNQ